MRHPSLARCILFYLSCCSYTRRHMSSWLQTVSQEVQSTLDSQQTVQPGTLSKRETTVTRSLRSTTSVESNFWRGIRLFLRTAPRTFGSAQLTASLSMSLRRLASAEPPRRMLLVARLVHQAYSLVIMVRHQVKRLLRWQQKRRPDPRQPGVYPQHLRLSTSLQAIMLHALPLRPTLFAIQFQPGTSPHLQSTRPGPPRQHSLVSQRTVINGIS